MIIQCNHKWVLGKTEDFAYCHECLCCIKDGKIYTRKEYIKLFINKENDQSRLNCS